MDQISDWQTSTNVESAPPPVETPAPTPDPASQPGPEASAAPESSESVKEPAEVEFERDAKGRIRRHRARSQQAGPEDVPRIAELTRRLRETEAKLAEITDSPKEEPRLPEPQGFVTAPGEFADPEPQLEQFADKPDPYVAYLRAIAAWDRKREAFETLQAQIQQQQERAHATLQQQYQQVFQTHDARVRDYSQKNPDYQTRLSSAPGKDIAASEIVHLALMLDPNGPERILYLAEHPDELEDLNFATVGRPITPQFVAYVQRRLTRPQAATTGSAASGPSLVPAPRPLNPVRTAPTTAPESIPGDDASLEEHERQWGRKRRRA